MTTAMVVVEAAKEAVVEVLAEAYADLSAKVMGPVTVPT